MGIERHSIPDHRTGIPAADGYHLAWCVGIDGEAWPWLVRDRCDDTASHGDRNVIPAHERIGRLPRSYREGLGLVHRCGAPTRRGSPCQQVVTEPGMHCGVHAAGRARR